jgi:type III secretory pathway component EscR
MKPQGCQTVSWRREHTGNWRPRRPPKVGAPCSLNRILIFIEYVYSHVDLPIREHTSCISLNICIYKTFNSHERTIIWVNIHFYGACLVFPLSIFAPILCNLYTQLYHNLRASLIKASPFDQHHATFRQPYHDDKVERDTAAKSRNQFQFTIISGETP